MNKFVKHIAIKEHSYESDIYSFLTKFARQAENHNLNIFEIVKDSRCMFAIKEGDYSNVLESFSRFLERCDGTDSLPIELDGYRFRIKGDDGILFVIHGVTIEDFGYLYRELVRVLENDTQLENELINLDAENKELKKRIEAILKDSEKCSIKNAELHRKIDELQSLKKEDTEMSIERIVKDVCLKLSKHEDVLIGLMKIEQCEVNEINISFSDFNYQPIRLRFDKRDGGCIIEFRNSGLGNIICDWFELKGETTDEIITNLVDHIVKELLHLK